MTAVSARGSYFKTQRRALPIKQEGAPLVYCLLSQSYRMVSIWQEHRLQ